MSNPELDQLRTIAHPLRYAILLAIRDGERNVSDIEEISGISQPALSQQLAFLRKADLVKTRRDAKLVYYAINLKQLEPVIAFLDCLRPPSSTQPSRGEQADSQRPTSGAARFARIT